MKPGDRVRITRNIDAHTPLARMNPVGALATVVRLDPPLYVLIDMDETDQCLAFGQWYLMVDLEVINEDSH